MHSVTLSSLATAPVAAISEAGDVSRYCLRDWLKARTGNQPCTHATIRNLINRGIPE